EDLEDAPVIQMEFPLPQEIKDMMAEFVNKDMESPSTDSDTTALDAAPTGIALISIITLSENPPKFALEDHYAAGGNRPLSDAQNSLVARLLNPFSSALH